MSETTTPATAYEVRPLTAETWPAFEDLVAQHNGIFGGCWCIWFHPDCAERGQGRRPTGCSRSAWSTTAWPTRLS